MKKIIYLFLFLLAMISLTYAQPVHPSVAKAYDATCAVISSNSVIGSGVLLNDGYIVTAAHVVDHNSNCVLDKEEEIIHVYFFKNHQRIQCKVISLGDITNSEPGSQFLDVAILKPNIELQSNIKLSTTRAVIGTPIFTIGMLRGGPPTITDGRINYPESYWIGRASAPVYSGNSGGGIFLKEKDECTGIVSQVLGEGRVYHIHGKRIVVLIPIYHASLYVPAFRIQKVIRYLKQKELEKFKKQLIIELFEELHKKLKRRQYF